MKQTPILIAAALGAFGLMLTTSNANADSCNSRRPVVQQADWTYSNTYDNTYDTAYNNQTRRTNVRFQSNQRAERRLVKKRRKMVRRLMNRLDWNGDGYISRREARSSRDLRRKFRRIDRNRDGYIGNRELNRHLRRVQSRSVARF